jgi:hypothetical protein
VNGRYRNKSRVHSVGVRASFMYIWAVGTGSIEALSASMPTVNPQQILDLPGDIDLSKFQGTIISWASHVLVALNVVNTWCMLFAT